MNKKIFPKDKTMQKIYEKVISHYGELPVPKPLDPSEYFSDLCQSIIGQQLSEKVAPKIVEKVKALLPNGVITPENILNTSSEILRTAGPSNSKIAYMKNVATAWQDGSVHYKKFKDMENEDIITELTKIKGIGRWTSEMFLMFSMARTDVFSVGDYGLKRAIIREYKVSEDIKPKELLELSSNWAPNRTLACRVLWRSLNISD